MAPFLAGLLGAYGIGLVMRAEMFDQPWQYLDGCVMLFAAGVLAGAS